LILEGIVTTINEDGSVNISPMGPIVNESMSRFVLRPYQTSTTYHNLKRIGEGVFHVTDNVEMLARAAISELTELPDMIQAEKITGFILTDACRWYGFRTTLLDDHEERTRIECEVVDSGRQRDFIGFNRAKHAVVEAAILATRIGILPDDQINEETQRLATIVEKTAGSQEKRAFAFLQKFIQKTEHGRTRP